jgi:hypothetical protein
MANKLLWHTILPESSKAFDLYLALRTLVKYYSQGKGKAAQNIKALLLKAFPESSPGDRYPPFSPANLSPMDRWGQEAEGPIEVARRQDYYTEVLRPALTYPPLVIGLEKVRIRSKYLTVTAEERDKAVVVLQAAIPYWDAHFHVNTSGE